MPAKYEAIRDEYIAAGKSVPLAKKLAAMTYNSQRKRGQAPVTGSSEEPQGALAGIIHRARMAKM